MATTNQPPSSVEHPEDLFANSPTSARPKPSSSRLLGEVLAETGREARNEERIIRSELAQYRNACRHRQLAADDERREAARESMRREERRQRRAATMRTRELAAILGEQDPLPATNIIASGEFYATSVAIATPPEPTQPTRRTRHPYVLGSLFAILLATLLVPSAVSGSAPMLDAPLAKQSVMTTHPVSSNLETVAVVLIQQPEPVVAAEIDDREERSSSRRSRRHRSERRAERAEVPVEVPSASTPRLDIDLDGSDVFRRGSD